MNELKIVFSNTPIDLSPSQEKSSRQFVVPDSWAISYVHDRQAGVYTYTVKNSMTGHELTQMVTDAIINAIGDKKLTDAMKQKIKEEIFKETYGGI